MKMKMMNKKNQNKQMLIQKINHLNYKLYKILNKVRFLQQKIKITINLNKT